MRGVFIMLVCLLPLAASAVSEPPHEVIVKDEKIELREYSPKLIAQVTVTGSMRSAGNKGFRLLADFIFGNNEPAEKIQMTAPVTRTEATKIAMTAPVGRVENSDNTWTVTFVMPDKWTLETLPKPNNPKVTIRAIPSELIAAIRFSGRGALSSHKKRQAELEQWISDNGYIANGEPSYAGYDAPWVLWPFRRNEVMIPVTKRK